MIKYYLDNQRLDELGIYISSSSGVVDLPKFKKSTEVSMPDANGTLVDLEERRLESRKITLQCFVKASSSVDFLNKVNRLNELLASSGIHYLRIDIGNVLNESTALHYYVYPSEQITYAKKWSDTDMVGTFTLTLTEPQSEKCVIRVKAGVNPSLYIKPKGYNLQGNGLRTPYVIYWGDGSMSEQQTLTLSTHTYTDKTKQYDIVIYGVESKANNIVYGNSASNYITIWQHLY